MTTDSSIPDAVAMINCLQHIESAVQGTILEGESLRPNIGKGRSYALAEVREMLEVCRKYVEDSRLSQEWS